MFNFCVKNIAQVNESIWVGVVNTYMVECEEEACSSGDLHWIDGTVADQAHVMKDAGVNIYYFSYLPG